MKKELQKQMDSMMNMTMEAITNNKKLEPALNELFKYAPQDEKYQFILLHEIANQYLHELLDIDSEFHDYSFEEGIKICIEKNDMFLLSFFDSETDEFYPVTGKLINEELNKKEIELERIQVIEAQNEGPWVEENEHRTLEEQNDQLVSGFFFNKMFYERPDLFEELENGKDIEELLFQMIDEELNDDVFDTDLLN